MSKKELSKDVFVHAAVRFQSLKEEWTVLVSREPIAWVQERSQYIALLREGRIEEFFLLVCDFPPLFSSFFVLKEGFLFWEGDGKPSESVLRTFCAHLHRIKDYAPELGLFWEGGLFDRFLFQVLGDMEGGSDVEKEAMVEASLRMRTIQSTTIIVNTIHSPQQVDIKKTPQKSAKTIVFKELDRLRQQWNPSPKPLPHRDLPHATKSEPSLPALGNPSKHCAIVYTNPWPCEMRRPKYRSHRFRKTMSLKSR